jgi:ABC-type glycerol-3-phosphate transport system substrate-binding protein
VRRRSFAAAVAALAVFGLSAACTAGGNEDPGSKGAATLSFLTFETPNLTAAFWDEAIKRTSAKVPGVTIKKLVSPNSDYAGYAKQLLASGQLPDLMIGISPADFAKAGALAPFKSGDLGQFLYPQAGQIDGSTYQLPWATQGVPLVYYNKDAFAKAGITAPPKTWAEFLDACAKLKAAGVTPVEIGGGGTDTWAVQYPLIAAVSADVYTASPQWAADLKAGKASFTDPKFIAAAAKIESLAKNGYLDQAGLSRSYANTEQAFRDGKAAMYPMGSWFPASADAKAPAFGVGVFTWPTDSGKSALPAYTGGGITVSAKAGDVAAAQKWAIAFSTDKDNLDAFVKADGTFMAIKGYTPPTGIGANYKASFDLFQQAAADGAVVNAFSTESGSTAIPGATVADMHKAIVDLITGKKTAEQFAAHLAESYKKNS